MYGNIVHSALISFLCFHLLYQHNKCNRFPYTEEVDPLVMNYMEGNILNQPLLCYYDMVKVKQMLIMICMVQKGIQIYV